MTFTKLAAGRRLLFALVLVMLLPGAGEAAKRRPPTAADQLEFGVEMARRGLWSEALFRFNQALTLSPGNDKILNNMAVAYEAVGRFDLALETYQAALKANPGSADLKRNYAQFIEFYQGFRPREETEDEDAGDDSAEPAEDTGAASGAS